jgi:HSP20 family protein
MKLMKKHGNKSSKTEPSGGLARRGEWPLAHLREEVDRAFERVWHSIEEGRWPSMSDIAPWPAIDVSEDEKVLTLRVDVPGLEAKDIDVEVSGNRLTVEGFREEEATEKNGGVKRHERRTGRFQRSLTLPSYVDADKVDARYDKGILTVTLPKIPGKEPRRVHVKAT